MIASVVFIDPSAFPLPKMLQAFRAEEFCGGSVRFVCSSCFACRKTPWQSGYAGLPKLKMISAIME
jgi:hypothetical protein